MRFCYEAGPTGYGLKREIEALGHECAVIAPSLIPRKPGDRVKTNRRDAEKLARLFHAAELTEIWTPDAAHAHEAMRDLIRAREAAVEDRTRKRQEIRSFLLRHGKIYSGLKIWGTVSQMAAWTEFLIPQSASCPAGVDPRRVAVPGKSSTPGKGNRRRPARLALAPVVERLQALRGVKLIWRQPRRGLRVRLDAAGRQLPFFQ
ncbi:hypothetical protein [Mesorhizobium sp.]|uniref:hypothetical protein n=1 Tax=Mesorhizobium sp. TaxID=1871066 RepID=UPI002626D2AA|nr:hypothetical protein [Mesorhizobium sp.]